MMKPDLAQAACILGPLSVFCGVEVGLAYATKSKIKSVEDSNLECVYLIKETDILRQRIINNSPSMTESPYNERLTQAEEACTKAKNDATARINDATTLFSVFGGIVLIGLPFVSVFG